MSFFFLYGTLKVICARRPTREQIQTCGCAGLVVWCVGMPTSPSTSFDGQHSFLSSSLQTVQQYFVPPKFATESVAPSKSTSVHNNDSAGTMPMPIHNNDNVGADIAIGAVAD